MTHTITFIGFEQQIKNIIHEEPKIRTIVIENLSEDIITCKDCSYHGVITDVPKDSFLPFADILEEKMDLDKEFHGYSTLCMLVNDTVLFMDLFCNSDDYTAHPLCMIGLANILREKLDKIFPTKKLTYLSQCQEWFKKQEKYHEDHKESMTKIFAQMELLKQLHPR